MAARPKAEERQYISIKLERHLVDWIDRVRREISTEYRVATRADVVRAALLKGLPALERKPNPKRSRRKSS